MSSVARLIFTLAVMLAIVSRPAPYAMAQAPTFNGVWSSAGCEPWPGRPFAYRELTIAGAAYRLDVTSFADDKCTIPTLRTRYEGRFTVRNPSPTIPETWDVEFAIQRALLIPYILNTADFLNSAPRGTCGAERWYVGIEQDLTATGGCLLIGLDVRGRPVEYDIATVQANQLLLGQRPGDGGLLFAPERRPTAFGPPLLRLGDAAPLPPLPGDTILLPPVGADQTLVAALILLGAGLLTASRRLRRVTQQRHSDRAFRLSLKSAKIQ